jgi:hypothetical protein
MVVPRNYCFYGVVITRFHFIPVKDFLLHQYTYINISLRLYSQKNINIHYTYQLYKILSYI